MLGVAMWVSNVALASGLAVGLSIGAMILTRSSHPPGGATALAAVIGGAQVEALGYWYLLYPVLLNCLVIFLFAVLFNNLFGWRRYPQGLMRYKFVSLSPEATGSKLHLNSHDFRASLSDLGVALDVSAEQLEHIYLNALKHRELQSLKNGLPKEGELYSNNAPGARWSVRVVLELASHPDPAKQLVIYKVIDGDSKGRIDSCSLMEFKRWASVRALPKA